LRYLAVPFQWELARQALVLTSDAPGRHPDSTAWESRFRRPLPGESHAEQLAVVEAWFRDDWDDVARRESVIYGARRPSALEALVGASDAGRERRVATLLTWFPGCEWPLAHLVPDPPPSPSSSSSEGA
jgi:hypothetical protein